MTYRADIDGLRALAVISVILFHSGVGIMPGGFVGVDVFFVISGFLITSIISADISERTFSLVHFYERRCRRILPALFLVMGTSTVFAWLWLYPNDLHNFGQSLVATSLFSSNILFWMETGYFAPAAELKPLLHTWSLSVEEQFYLIFPILLFIISSERLKNTIVPILVISVIFSASFLTSNLIYIFSPSANFFLLPSRIWELLIGAMTYFYTQRSMGPQEPAAREVLSLSGVFLIIASMLFFDENTPTPSIFSLAPTIGTALFIGYSATGTLSFRIFSFPAAVKIGLISYSAYLWHHPIFAFARHLSPTPPSNTLMLLLSGFTLLVSFLSWRFVEQPFRDKNLFNSKAVFYATAGCSAFFVTVGFAFHIHKGFPERVQEVPGLIGSLYSDEFFKYLDANFYHCSNIELMSEALVYKGHYKRCFQSQVKEEPEIVIVGDSHAEHLFPGLAKELSEKNVGYYIRAGLPIARNDDFKQVFRAIAKSSNTKIVIVTAAWSSRIAELPVGGSFFDAMSETVDLFGSLGKTVLLVNDVPYFFSYPDKCKFRLNLIPENTGCTMPEDYVTEYEKQYVPAMMKIANDRDFATYVEIKDTICRDGVCSMISGNKLLYRDNDHLNLLGSAAVAKKIEPYIN